MPQGLAGRDASILTFHNCNYAIYPVAIDPTRRTDRVSHLDSARISPVARLFKADFAPDSQSCDDASIHPKIQLRLQCFFVDIASTMKRMNKLHLPSLWKKNFGPPQIGFDQTLIYRREAGLCS
jgi:hypothetical protein